MYAILELFKHYVYLYILKKEVTRKINDELNSKRVLTAADLIAKTNKKDKRKIYKQIRENRREKKQI